MAVSPAHRFGQIIGEVLEATIEPLLEEFAKKHHLYLDKQGSRPCRGGLKVTWVDSNGNAHDLDYVLERGGAPDKLGIPIAFIETAWRRYTKHSRNKAQEIQGALVPLADTYRHVAPFKGAILAGDFTEGALTQLRSLGFTVLHFPYETVVAVFKKAGIDASYNEDTPDSAFRKQVEAYEKLSAKTRSDLSWALVEANASGVKEFIRSLSEVVSRQIQRIIILPLHGQSFELGTVDEAIRFIQEYDERSGSMVIQRYEIQVRYNNGNVVEGRFRDKASAVEFLRTYDPTPRPGT